ncbi:hypothetical protein EDD15DRAFT_2252285 [Pisolithus albus]|nr:hypothetical protein EDD15DRAFT_2252285 [Pisolithus albus]
MSLSARMPVLSGFILTSHLTILAGPHLIRIKLLLRNQLATLIHEAFCRLITDSIPRAIAVFIHASRDTCTRRFLHHQEVRISPLWLFYITLRPDRFSRFVLTDSGKRRTCPDPSVF